LIFLAFLLPVAVYLLILGSINRRRGPVLVSGTWDMIGLLFAASGFLLVTGPALLSSGYERWRLFWLLGPQGAAAPDDGGQRLWLYLAGVYFLAVLAVAAHLLWRARASTSVYNVEPADLETALAVACDRLGLAPVRSGNLLVFGAAPATADEAAAAQGAQASATGTLAAPLRQAGAPVSDLSGQSAVLELDAFPAMRHVTLRWDPAESPLRREVETELERALAETLTPESDLGPILSLSGWALLLLSLVGGVVVVLVRVLAQA
jgi:hypothetical protein